MPVKLCNMTYTDDQTGAQRLCQDGTARPAAYHRLGARVCEDCWPAVQDKLTQEFGGRGKNPGKEALMTQAFGMTFRKVR